MSGLQIFLLGVMTALTPSMIVIAVALWLAPKTDGAEEDPQA